jgi:hypothetical protein
MKLFHFAASYLTRCHAAIKQMEATEIYDLQWQADAAIEKVISRE